MHLFSRAFLLCLSFGPASGFVVSPLTPPWTTPRRNVASHDVSTRDGTALHAIGVLARKAKEMDVRKYIEAGLPDDVTAHMSTISSSNASSSEASPGPLQQSLTRRKGTIAILAEYTRKVDANFISGVPPPEILSETFRDGGAAAVAVACDPRTSGCDYEDVVAVVEEQASAQGEVPGPLVVVAADLVVDVVQVARAKAAGAGAVLVSVEVAGEEGTKEIVKAAKALGMEAVVGVANEEEAKKAVEAADAKILLITGKDGVEDKQAVMEAVPNREDVCVVANVLARENKALEEVEEVWVLRDMGFNAVWVSDTLYKSGNDPVEHPSAIIRSMCAKSSVKYASARAKSGRGEGAKEYLGDIMM